MKRGLTMLTIRPIHAAAGMIVAAALLLSGCQQLSLKTQIKSAVEPVNATSPWITAYGDRSVSLSWAEPSDSDMGAVEIIATPTFGTGVTPLQAVIAAGKQTATLTLPTNNASYTITVFMVDKGGNVSKTGITTSTGHSFHWFLDPAASVGFSFFPPMNIFASQLPVKTVSHFEGTGAGVLQGYDSYTYDSTTGLPSEVISYSATGVPQSKHDMQYATGSVNRMLDTVYSYSGSTWQLSEYVNTYSDSAGRTTGTELYYGSPIQLQASSTYNLDSSGNLTGFVTSNSAGTVLARTTYINLGTKEQWARANGAGVVQSGGLIECDYDSAGRPSALIEYNTSNMSVAFQVTNSYDSNGNLMEASFASGTPLVQEGYDIYSY